VVQLIRQFRFDIAMPDYWRKYDETKHDTCVLRTKNNPIPFNFIDRRRNVLKTIPIGQVCKCIETLLEEDERFSTALGPFSDDRYINSLAKFSFLRNDAAHIGGVPLEDFKEMHHQFVELMENYMKEFVALKKQLKN